MNVLWITNHPIGEFADSLKLHYASGSWMESTMEVMQMRDDIQLSQASIAPVHKFTYKCINDVNCYCVPCGRKKIYDYNDKTNKAYWKKIVDEVKPDIIMLWGTEYAHGLCAMLVANEIPKVILIQGILRTIDKYYLGGMSFEELIRAYTIRDLLKRDSIREEQKLYRRKAKIEAMMLQYAHNIIIENEWAKSNVKYIEPNAKFYEYRQLVKSNFLSTIWSYDLCDKETIFCTSPVAYPLKGFHQLIKALILVKKEFPNVQLRVPGINSPLNISGIQKFKQKGYFKYISDLIKDNDLENNIIFLGKLNSGEIANELKKCNLFIVPSAIENQSISLREAMVMGVPCITSVAGGMLETADRGQAAMVYRYEEYEQLADCIKKILSNNKFSQDLGKRGRNKMLQYLNEKTSPQTLIDIYNDILDNR